MLDIVKAVNVGTEDYIAKHDRYGEILIPAGSSKIMPLAVALVCFGNPGSRNDGKNKLRDLELKHVQLYHGFPAGFVPDSAWEDWRPKVEIYDVENDTRIWMVHDDPTGENASSGLAETIAQATNPEAILARHRAEQEARHAEALAEPSHELTHAERNQVRDDIPTAPDDEDEPTEDKPRTARAGTRTKTK